MKSNKQTIEQIGGFVTIHVALPPPLLRWVVRRARAEGHKDVSVVMRRGIDLLRERQRAGLPLA